MAKRKSVPNVYLWCSRVEQGKTFGMKQTSGFNCEIKVEGTKKCRVQGKPAKCVDTAFIYEVPAGYKGYRYPKYRGKK
jgi:hypothetical protein